MPLRVLFPLFVLVLVGCTQRDIKDELVLLDQSFIPALILTTDNDLEGARRTMPVLKEDWRLFKIHNSGFAHSDAQWKSDVARIDQSFALADSMLKAGRPDAARPELAAVRGILRETRRRYKIDYFPDLLTGFREPLETLLAEVRPLLREPVQRKGIGDPGSGVRDQTPDSDTRHLTPDTQHPSLDSVFRAIGGTLGRANGLWSGIQSYAFNPGEYHLTTGKVALMKEYLTGEAAALAQLQSAIEKKDRKAVVTAAAVIEPDYDRLYRLFGNFGRRD